MRHRRHISTRCVDANAGKRREKNSDDGFARVCVRRRRRIARAGTMDDAMIARATPRSIHLPEETSTRRRRSSTLIALAAMASTRCRGDGVPAKATPPPRHRRDQSRGGDPT